MYLVSGAYEAISQPVMVDGEKVSQGYGTNTILVTPRTLVYCPPYIAHAYRFTEDSVFLNITTGPGRDPADFDIHTVKYDILL
jgi:hypothetical protein